MVVGDRRLDEELPVAQPVELPIVQLALLPRKQLAVVALVVLELLHLVLEAGAASMPNLAGKRRREQRKEAMNELRDGTAVAARGLDPAGNLDYLAAIIRSCEFDHDERAYKVVLAFQESGHIAAACAELGVGAAEDAHEGVRDEEADGDEEEGEAEREVERKARRPAAATSRAEYTKLKPPSARSAVVMTWRPSPNVSHCGAKPPTVAARSPATMYDATRVCVFCNQFFLEHIEQVALEDY